MKKILRIFVAISVFIFVGFFIYSSVSGSSVFNSFDIDTKGAYLISQVGKILLNDSDEINVTPFSLRNGTKLSSSAKSGGLIVLGTGEELGLSENSEIIILSNRKIKLLKGELKFLTPTNDALFVLWDNYSFRVRDKTVFLVKEIKKRRNQVEYRLVIKICGRPVKANIDGGKVLLNGSQYLLDSSGIISEFQMIKAPELKEPVDKKNISIDEGSNIVFKWNRVVEANSYNFYFSYNPIFLNSRLINIRKSFTTINITDFKESPVFWKVCSVDRINREGLCSEPFKFHIKNLIQILQLWKNPPKLKIEGPLTPTGNLVIIKGSTDLGVNLTINGEEVNVDSSGNFMHILRFNTIGEHSIRIVARNLSGAEKVFTKNVIIYEK